MTAALCSLEVVAVILFRFLHFSSALCIVNAIVFFSFSLIAFRALKTTHLLLSFAMAEQQPSGKTLVSLLNINDVEPIKEGLNSPRSCGICARFSVAPRDLKFKSVEEFTGPKVTQSAAVLRQRSYEKKRQSLLAKLVPERQKIERPGAAAADKADAEPKADERKPRSVARETRGESPNRRSPSRRSPSCGSDRNGDKLNETKERYQCMMDSQEGEQLNRMLEKEIHKRDVLIDTATEKYKKRVAHYYARRNREIAAANRRRMFEAEPQLSPHRKTIVTAAAAEEY